MARTYSLQRLLLGITLACVLCGLVVSFPAACLAATVFAAAIVPTLLLMGLLASCSARRGDVLFAALGGAACAIMLTPSVMSMGPPDWWRDYIYLLINTAALAFVGTLLFGGVVLLIELCGPIPIADTTPPCSRERAEADDREAP